MHRASGDLGGLGLDGGREVRGHDPVVGPLAVTFRPIGRNSQLDGACAGGEHRTMSAVAGPPQTDPAFRPDAFISYSREDAGLVRGRLAPALRERGKTIWLDEGLVGGSRWRPEVESALNRAKALVFVVTRHSLGSQECLRELDHAVGASKLIVPVAADAVRPEQAPSALRDRQWIWLFEDERWDGAIELIAEALETDFEWRDMQSRLSEKADEWRAAEGDPSRLLRGTELSEADAWLRMSP